MRKLTKPLVLAAVFAFIALGLPAAGQESMSTVPVAIDQIQEPVLREALQQYSPSYNSLSRGEQINAFTNIYKVLNNGQLPPLTASESQLLGQTQAYLYPPSSGTVMGYDPWADPSYDPFLDEIGVLNSDDYGFGFGWGGSGWGPPPGPRPPGPPPPGPPPPGPPPPGPPPPGPPPGGGGFHGGGFHGGGGFGGGGFGGGGFGGGGRGRR